jgi:hypothetical protein
MEAARWNFQVCRINIKNDRSTKSTNQNHNVPEKKVCLVTQKFNYGLRNTFVEFEKQKNHYWVQETVTSNTETSNLKIIKIG